MKSLENLPDTILQHEIIDTLLDKRDILNLCQTSHKFKSLCYSRIYSSLHIVIDVALCLQDKTFQREFRDYYNKSSPPNMYTTKTKRNIDDQLQVFQHKRIRKLYNTVMKNKSIADMVENLIIEEFCPSVHEKTQFPEPLLKKISHASFFQRFDNLRTINIPLNLIPNDCTLLGSKFQYDNLSTIVLNGTPIRPGKFYKSTFSSGKFIKKHKKMYEDIRASSTKLLNFFKIINECGNIHSLYFNGFESFAESSIDMRGIWEARDVIGYFFDTLSDPDNPLASIGFHDELATDFNGYEFLYALYLYDCTEGKKLCVNDVSIHFSGEIKSADQYKLSEDVSAYFSKECLRKTNVSWYSVDDIIQFKSYIKSGYLEEESNMVLYKHR